MRLFLALISLLFISCSTTVSKLDDYKKVEFVKVSNIEKSTEKYQIFIENSFEDIYKVLKTLKNVEIIQKKDNSTDYTIRTKVEIKKFGQTEIQFGKVWIWNNQVNIMEEIFSISDLESELKNFFSKTRGYILEKRINRDDEVIFKISIGKNMNLKKGDTLNIYSFKKGIKFLSQKNSLVKYKIGTAIISDMIENQFCWIYFNNPKTAKLVSKGDLVISNQNTFGDYLEDGTLFMKNNDKILQNNLRL